MLKPSTSMIAKLVMSEMGIVTTGMNDARRVRRKTKITRTTRITASKIVS